MLKVSSYEKILVKVKGKWRFVYRAVYQDLGKGAGLEKSRDPTIFQVNGEIIKV